MSEYTLYPIRKSDVDWPLYHLVSHFLKIKYDLDSIIRDKAPDFKCIYNDVQQEKRDYVYHFIFPREDLSVPYNEAILEQEYVILKCFFPIEEPDPRWIGDDENFTYEEVPMEYFHYDESGSVLRHFLTDDPTEFPDLLYVDPDFSAAVNELLDFLRDKQLTDLAWYPRLQTVANMLEDNANELHILHNAGLYDHKTLWSAMKSHCVSQIEIEKLQNRYLPLLKQYAMFALNEIDWEYGTPVDKGDREGFFGLFSLASDEQVSKMKLEQERRLKMFQNKPNISQPVIEIPKTEPQGEPPATTPRTAVKTESSEPKPEPTPVPTKIVTPEMPAAAQRKVKIATIISIIIILAIALIPAILLAFCSR